MRRAFGGTASRPALLVAALTLATGRLAASDVLDLRLVEVDRDGARTYHNLIYSHPLGNGRFSLEGFWLFLPQEDDYDELAVGVGYHAFDLGEASVSFITYFAFAPDDDYLEPALFALDAEGPLTWSLFLLRYLPLSDAGIDQWLIDPAEIAVAVGGPVSLGVSGYFHRPHGGSWLTKIGPKVSIGDRLGATEVAARWVDASDGFEIQLRRLLVF